MTMIKGDISFCSAEASVGKMGQLIKSREAKQCLKLGTDDRFNIELREVSDLSVPVEFQNPNDVLQKVSVDVHQLAERLHTDAEKVFQKATTGDLSNLIRKKLKVLPKSITLFSNTINAFFIKKENSEDLFYKDKPNKKLPFSAPTLMKICYAAAKNRSSLRLENYFFAFKEKHERLFIFDLSNFRDRLIGSGGFSQVYEIDQYKKIKIKNALKIPKDNTTNCAKEVEVLKKLQPYALKAILKPPKLIVDLFDAKKFVYKKGYIYKKLDSFQKNLFKIKKLKYKEQLANIQTLVDAIYCLHSNNITHTDIKTENVLLNPKNLSPRIIDWGGAHFKEQELPEYLPYGSITPSCCTFQDYKELELTREFYNKKMKKYMEFKKQPKATQLELAKKLLYRKIERKEAKIARDNGKKDLTFVNKKLNKLTEIYKNENFLDKFLENKKRFINKIYDSYIRKRKRLDVFHLGDIICLLLTGESSTKINYKKRRYKIDGREKKVSLLTKENYNFSPIRKKIIANWPFIMANMIEKMVKPKPKRRISMEQCRAMLHEISHLKKHNSC